LQSGVRLPTLSILDVAPLLLQSLDLDVPADMEGRVPAGALHPSWSRRRPAHQAPVPREPVPASSLGEGALFTKEDEAKLAQRLRDLGYIE